MKKLALLAALFSLGSPSAFAKESASVWDCMKCLACTTVGTPNSDCVASCAKCMLGSQESEQLSSNASCQQPKLF